MKKTFKLTERVLLSLVVAASLYVCPASFADTRGVLWVVKPNAALGCEDANTTSLQQGRKELEASGVEVLGSDFSSDTQAASAGCQIQGSVYDSYLIRKNSLSSALALGFTVASDKLKRPYRIVGH